MSCLLHDKKGIYNISVQGIILFLYYFLSAQQFLILFSKVCSFLISNLLTSRQESAAMLPPVGSSTQIILKPLKGSFLQLKREPKQFIGHVVFFVLLRYIDLNKCFRRFVQKKALLVKITFCFPLTCLYFFPLHFCSSGCL